MLGVAHLRKVGDFAGVIKPADLAAVVAILPQKS